VCVEHSCFLLEIGLMFVMRASNLSLLCAGIHVNGTCILHEGVLFFAFGMVRIEVRVYKFFELNISTCLSEICLGLELGNTG